jgi:hypothetical protein
MGIPWRPLACVAVLACALPTFAATIPRATASVGPARLTIVDTNPTDGITAGVTLTGQGGFHGNLSWIADPRGGGFWSSEQFGLFEPGTSGTWLSFFTWGESLSATTHSPSNGTPYSRSAIQDSWLAVVAPHTRVTFEFDATAAGGVAEVSAWLTVGAQTFSDLVTGSEVVSFDFETGADEVTGILTRKAQSLVDIRVTPAPEPGTYALLAVGLLAIAKVRRPVKGRALPAQVQSP